MMVRDGQAVAYRHFSTRYVVEEEEAHKAGRGFWATVFEMPFDWRRSHKAGGRRCSRAMAGRQNRGLLAASDLSRPVTGVTGVHSLPRIT